MGRAFEYRKARKMKRWEQMAKVFTKISREITLAVSQGGADPTNNPRLRLAIQNAKTANMPKKNVENAIQRALSKELSNLQEVVHEGYGPHGIAVVVECLTDNPIRTLAIVRMHFSRSGGALGTSGSLNYMFERKGEFIFPLNNLDVEKLELELIDAGADDIEINEEEICVYTAYEDFGNMQAKLEEMGIEAKETGLQRFPTTRKKLEDTQKQEIETLIDKLEDDNDVQKVFHNMAF